MTNSDPTESNFYVGGVGGVGGAAGAAGLPPNAAFVISVAARLVGVHVQTLRYYERAGLVEPARSKGRIRLYSLYDLERVRQIRRLTDEMGVNLAGVEVIMRLTDRIRELENNIDQLQGEVRRLRDDSPRGNTGS